MMAARWAAPRPLMRRVGLMTSSASIRGGFDRPGAGQRLEECGDPGAADDVVGLGPGQDLAQGEVTGLQRRGR